MSRAPVEVHIERTGDQITATARRDGEVVGTLVAFLDGEVADSWVAVGARRQGVATALYTALARRVEQRGGRLTSGLILDEADSDVSKEAQELWRSFERRGWAEWQQNRWVLIPGACP